MCNNDWVIWAVKVNFKMAAAAILDFMESEFLLQSRLWDTVLVRLENMAMTSEAHCKN